MWPLGLTLDMTLLWIFKVKYEICCISTKSGQKVRWSDLPDCDRGDLNCRRAIDSSSWLKWLQYYHNAYLLCIYIILKKIAMQQMLNAF